MARVYPSLAMMTLSSAGSKMKQGAEFLGAIKTAFDTSRLVYMGLIRPLAAVALVAAE